MEEKMEEGMQKKKQTIREKERRGRGREEGVYQVGRENGIYLVYLA